MIDGEEAGGRFSLVEQRSLRAGWRHHCTATREDEYSCVVEGQVGALPADEVVIGGPGDLGKPRRRPWPTSAPATRSR
jgi:hypothetical protein